MSAPGSTARVGMVGRSSVIAPAAAIVAAHLPINAGPFLLGAIADGWQVGNARAGFLESLELIAFGLASVVTAFLVARLPTRKVAVAALLVAVGANTASIFSGSFGLLAGCRVVSGAGSGTLAALAYAVVAGMPDSEKRFAKCYAALFLSGMLSYLVLPPLVDAFHHRGVFGFIAVVSLALLPALFRFPARLGALGGGSLVSLFRFNVALLVAGAMLVTFSDGLVWPMTERMGKKLGLETGTIGIILAAAVLFGMSGLFAAARFGPRAGSVRPILIGAWGTATAGLIIALAGGTMAFTIGALLKNPFYFLALPYIMSCAAKMDPHGRVSALLGGLLPVGAGFGPWPAGAIADRFGFAPIGWVGIAAVAVATPLLVSAVRRV